MTKLILRIFCNKVTELCKKLPMDDTIILNGKQFLCILGKPYALGRMALIGFVWLF